MASPIITLSTGSNQHYSSSYTPNGGVNLRLNYYSVDKLYYNAFDPISGSINTSSSYDHYLESSFTTSSRYLGPKGMVYSIPQQLYGTHIEPGSLTFASGSNTITDDGEGNLILSSTGQNVGNIIYSHGQIIITNGTLFQTFMTSSGQPISWKSNNPIYTYNYNLKISDSEFNHTFNPTAQSGSTIFYYSGSTSDSSSRYIRPSGIYADNVTGSAFQPYITAVGLYNSSNELIAVGKFPNPIPKPADTEMTIQIKLDV